MTGTQLALLMEQHRTGAKYVAKAANVTVRRVQQWTATANREKPIPQARALIILKDFEKLGAAASSYTSPFIEAFLSLKVFDRIEVVHGAGSDSVDLAAALKGVLTERSVTHEVRATVFMETLKSLTRCGLDAVRFVQEISPSNPILDRIRKYLDARTCRLRVKPSSGSSVRLDPVWAESLLRELIEMEGKLLAVQASLKVFLKN